MNALSLLSIYFCFKAPYLLYTLNKTNPHKKITYFVIAWITALLIYTLVRNNFLIIKIHAGIVLVYSFIVHIIVYNRTKEKGSKRVFLGISISFIPIVTHTLKLSVHEWFNYKDLAHVIILISLIVIYTGVKTTSGKLSQKPQ